MNKENPIGIIGLGAVGSALKHTCEYFHKDVRGYDIKESYDWVPILDCTVVFVCVPTPGGSDGRLDCSAINHVLARLAEMISRE